MKRQEYERILLQYISKEFAEIEARFNAFTKKIKMKKTDEKELGKVKDEKVCKVENI